MSDPARPAPRANVPPRTLPEFSLQLTLNTEFSARVYRRCFDRLKGDLYVLTVRTRSAGMEEAAKAIEAVIAEAFGGVRKDLDSELERSDALLDDAKLTELAAYDGVPVTKATYSTPQAREFLDLLLKMDQLLMRYDALWLGQHIDTQQRWSRCQNWQRRLTKVANRLRELGNRTRAALTREAEKHAPAAVASSSETGSAGPSDESAEASSTEDREMERDSSDGSGNVQRPNEVREPTDSVTDMVSAPDSVASSVSLTATPARGVAA